MDQMQNKNARKWQSNKELTILIMARTRLHFKKSFFFINFFSVVIVFVIASADLLFFVSFRLAAVNCCSLVFQNSIFSKISLHQKK
jgi:hypothetical protein